jgi:glycine/D-amino acid oxidase-like deaminating enzyme
VAWTGGLLWELPPDQLAAFAAEHAAWGYRIHRVDRRAVQRIEPNLIAPPDFALHMPDEGSVEPPEASLALLNMAQGLGATVITHAPVRRLSLSAGHVCGVETDTMRHTADVVVVACGVGTSSLVATVGLTLPVTASPALLVVTRPHPRCLNGLVMSPEMQIRQTTEGRLIATADFADTDPDADGAAEAAALIGAMRQMIVSGASISLDHHVVARRPKPHDGFPVVGSFDGLPGLYVAVIHSGVTLAPAIGRFVADELLTGRRDDLLAPYGPGRLLGGSSAT